VRRAAAIVAWATITAGFARRRWVFTAAIRVGPWCGGIQTAPPWCSVEKAPTTGRSRMAAGHVGFVDSRPPEPDEKWWRQP
jgi:hypothetical protein